MEIHEFIDYELSKKSSNKFNIGHWFERLKKEIVKPVSEEQMIKLANADGLRTKLFLAGRNDHGLSDGFRNLANIRQAYITNPKKGKGKPDISMPSQRAKDFCQEAADLRLRYVKLIFSTQDNRDFLYYMSPGGLFLSWIMPSCFKQFKMSYQTDHILAQKRGGIDSLENFGFFSANTNIYVKNQLTIDELLNLYSEINPLCIRIKENMKRRKELFSSKEWLDFRSELLNFENNTVA